MKLQQYEQFTQAQYGLITRPQLLMEASENQLKYLLRAGYIESVRRGVYRIAGTPKNWEQALMVLTLSHSKYVISHRAAAQLWKLGNHWRHHVLEVSTTGPARNKLAGVVIHRAVLHDTHVTETRGLRVTSIERTLIDLAATSHETSIDLAIDAALSSKRTTIEKLEATLIDCRRPGRPNIRRVANLIEKRLEALTQSVLQRKALQWIKNAGLPIPTPEFTVRTRWAPYDIDLAYPDFRIAIECNGYIAHGHRTQFDRDAKRNSALAAIDWRLFFVTSNTDEHEFIEDLRHALVMAKKKAS